MDISKGVWHMVEALKAGGVIFECKEGTVGEHEVEGILEVKIDYNIPKAQRL